VVYSGSDLQPLVSHQKDSRIGNCFYSVVAALDYELDVARRQAVDTLQTSQSRKTSKRWINRPLEQTQV
jgi:hypothetical protein